MQRHHWPILLAAVVLRALVALPARAQEGTVGYDESSEPVYVNVGRPGDAQPTMMRAEDRDGVGVIEGDVAIGQFADIVKANQSLAGIRFSRYPASRWSNNQIPYIISVSDFTSRQRQQIQNAINSFNSRSRNLKIVPRTSQPDYVRVISGNGCYSYLGRAGGEQPLSLQRNGCLSSGTIQHEFIHAAGATHEHNRPDRDDHVRVLWENIPPEWRSQYEKASPEEFSNMGRYECSSVMHYPLNAPGSNKPAFEIIDVLGCVDVALMGQRVGPTEGDLKGIDELYAKEVSP